MVLWRAGPRRWHNSSFPAAVKETPSHRFIPKENPALIFAGRDGAVVKPTFGNLMKNSTRNQVLFPADNGC